MTTKATSVKENKMGTMEINPLLVSMAVPMMISMLVQALYNVVDSIFVARISENALTAVSLSFPMQNLMIAIATGTGVGINALLSRSLGEKNFKRANDTAANGLFLALLGTLAFVIIGLFFTRTFFESQTKDLEIINYGVDYLQVCTVASFGLFGAVTFERLLQSTGKTVYAMITQMAGALTNIILDPILIFGLLGFPKLGIAGAAIATVAGQILSLILGCYFNMARNKEIHVDFKAFKPQGKIIKKIYAVGIPSIIMASIGSLMNFGMNKILMSFTSTATAVFGVYFKLQSFIFMPVFGLNNGMVPIIAYNYGAKHKKRITKTIRLAVTYAIAIMLIGFLVFQLIPDKLLLLFDASPSMLSIGIHALKKISFSFILAGFCIVSSSVFQALGHGVLSMWISIIRQLVVLLPSAYLLSRLGNVDLVWWSFPIAELASVVLCAFFLRYVYNGTISKLHPQEEELSSNIEAVEA